MKVRSKRDMLMSALRRKGGPNLSTVIALLKGAQRDAHDDRECPPCAFAQHTYSGSGALFGINGRDFWKINDSAKRESALYWQCLEVLRPLARELLWLLVSMLYETDDMRLFSKIVEALPSCRSKNGTKTVRGMGFLLIDVIIRDCNRMEDWVCKALELFLSQCPGDDRQIYLLNMLDTVMCCAEGVFEGAPGEHENRQEYKRKLGRIDQYLENKFGETIKNLDESIFKEYFGIKDDADAFHAMVSVGKLPVGMRYYARALILKHSCNLLISEELLRAMVVNAIVFDDNAHFWKDRDYRVVSLVSADCLCGMRDLVSRWNEYSASLAQMLYVGLHGNRTIERHRYDERMGMYLETAVAMVDNFCRRKQFEVALLVWHDAWNVCVTALYGCVLSGTPLNMIQCLYTYRMKYMPGLSPDKMSVALLGQLPKMVMCKGSMINVQDACVQTLRRNQQ